MHEQFYEEQETSAMKELRNKGFRKLNVRHINGYQETSIYNNESLHFSVCLGEDYNLAGRQHEITSDFKVDSYISWNTGYAVTLSLERSMEVVRIVCGTITVKGAFGHISERKFCAVGRLNEITFFSFFYVTLSSKRTFLRLPLVHVQKSGAPKLALPNSSLPIKRLPSRLPMSQVGPCGGVTSDMWILPKLFLDQLNAWN